MSSTPQLDRRDLMRLSLAGGAGLALGARGHGRTLAQDAGTPQPGGILRIGIPEDPTNLDPYGSGGAWVKRNVLRGLFESLIDYDQTGEWVPALAEAWEVSPDGLTITFNLRQGVTFHDETPCDAEAVKWNIETLWLHEETGQAALRSLFAGAEAVDAATIRFTLNQPDVTALARVQSEQIVSPTAYQSLGPDEFGLNPVGTGPYRFGSWARGGELAVVRNETYWNPERPYLDGITWVMLPEPTIRLINLTGGDIDAATFVPLRDVERMRAEEGIEVGISVGGYSGLMFNITDPPFDQLANREAFLAAIDYQAIIDAVYFGLAEPSTGGLIPPINYAFNGSLPALSRDLDLARAKLEEAGNPDGFEFLAIPGVALQESQRMMEVIQATAAEVGIAMNLEQVERGRYAEITNQDHHAAQLLQYDVAFIHLSPILRFGVANCDAPNNFAEWCNEDFQAAMANATGALDRETEIAAVREAEQVMIAEKPYSSLLWLPFAQAWGDRVQGYVIDYAGDAGLQDVWLADA